MRSPQPSDPSPDPLLSAPYIYTVQHLIEQCLLFLMDREECVKALAKHAHVKPVITTIVWNELEKANHEFFVAYQKKLASRQAKAPTGSYGDSRPPSQTLRKIEKGLQSALSLLLISSAALCRWRFCRSCNRKIPGKGFADTLKGLVKGIKRSAELSWCEQAKEVLAVQYLCEAGILTAESIRRSIKHLDSNKQS